MDQAPSSRLAELAAELHAIAKSVIEQDGEHAPMFFMRLPNGDLKAELFEAADRPVRAERARQMAQAVRQSGADAVVLVSEAWRRARAAAHGGDAAATPATPEASDTLVVAAIDRGGDEVLLETPVIRRADGSVQFGETLEGGRMFTFDEVRAIWGL